MKLNALLKKVTDSLKHERRAVPIEVERTALSQVQVVTHYRVGAFTVQIVEAGGRYEYAVKPLEGLDDLYRLVSEKLDDITPLLKRRGDISDVLAAVLKIPRERVPEALYVLRSVLSYGKLQVLLDDPYIQDVCIEGAGRIWVRHSLVELLKPEQDFAPTNIALSSIEEVVALQQVIATKCNVYISTSNPIVDAQLPQSDGGHRVHLVFPTISQNRPEVVIRKRMPYPPHLDQLVEAGVLPKAIVDLLKLVISARGSVIIAGPPGSGKTTLLRSILYSLIPRTWKVIVIEDTGEINPPLESPWTHYTAFELGAVKVDLFDLAKASLRASGTRLIVVGETRGAEAQVLSQAMLVGLGAFTTFHSASPEEVASRLMSPPINLTASQVGMFHYVLIMGYGDKPRRQLKLLAELEYVSSEDSVASRVLWDRHRDGVDVAVHSLLLKSKRWSELAPRCEVPIEVSG
ncbi:MAG: type II/IV secretion system ATPase subunit [Desulfurococcaceae archaeon]